jgi:two-component system, OmpR family, response regulator RegX3
VWHREIVRVLVVEDDSRIAGPLVKGLRREGLEADHVSTGAEAIERMAGEAHALPDVVLLDLRLPDLDGLEVCRRIRAEHDIPIIVVTARGEEVDRVLGLLARIRAVTRRAQPRPAAQTVCLGPLTIDRRTRRATVGGEELNLTPKEFDLLALLAEDPDAVWPRSRILEEVWDPHWYGPTKTLDVHVATLRKKLGHPEWIETVRGVGFRLDIEDTA